MRSRAVHFVIDAKVTQTHKESGTWLNSRQGLKAHTLLQGCLQCVAVTFDPPSR